jgi:hypothetical protein
MALEEKVLLLSPDIAMANAAVDAYSTQTTGLEASNVLTDQPKDRWRTTSDTTQYVDIDFQAAVSVDSVWIGYTNMSDDIGAKVRITMGATIGASTYDSGQLDFLSPWPGYAGARDEWDRVHRLVDLGTPKTYRYMRVTLTDPVNPNGYLEVGRILAGIRFQPGINIQYGGTIPFPSETADKLETEGGSIYPIPKGLKRQIDVAFQFAGSSGETEIYRYLYRYAMSRGASKPILYIHDPTHDYAHWGTVYGVPTSPWLGSDSDFEWRIVRFSLGEMP